MSDWEQTLADLTAHLDAVEASLDGGAPVLAWEPPVGLGPLPAELGERATAVLRRSEHLERLVVQRMDDLRHAARPATTGGFETVRASAQILDRRA